MIDITNLQHLVSLNASERVGCVLFRRLLDRFGTLEGIARAGERSLASVDGVGPAAAAEIRRAFTENRGAREIDAAARHRVRIIPFDHPETPAGLRVVYDNPLLLYVRGDLREDDAVAFSIVGTRQPTPYGLAQARRFSATLSSHGLTIVSGLARGIDTAAHHAALENGRTIAVLGSGVLRVYPESNDSLARRIAERGALLSEFPLHSEPSAVHFPRRNRLIAALGLGTLVVESGESSGANITATWAVEEGKDVWALPGRIDSPKSAGCHKLIQQGAKLAMSPEEIVEDLGLGLEPSKSIQSGESR